MASASPIPAPPQPSPSATPAVPEFLAGGRTDEGDVWLVVGRHLLLSRQGGNSWRTSAIDPGTPYVLDREHAWNVSVGPGSTPHTGSRSDVLKLVASRSSDGGLTWMPSEIPGNFRDTTQSLVFLDANHGYLLCSALRFGNGRSTVLATADGGRTWTVRGQAQWLGSTFTASDASTLWAGAEPEAGPISRPTLMVSRDGGASWQPTALPGVPPSSGGGNFLMTPPFFTTPDTGFVAYQEYLVGSRTMFFDTTDGGRTWRRASVLNDAGLAPIEFAGATNWFVPARNTLWHTTNGGSRWVNVPTAGLRTDGAIEWLGVGPQGMVAAVQFEGENTSIYVSTDAGAQWSPASLHR